MQVINTSGKLYVHMQVNLPVETITSRKTYLQLPQAPIIAQFSQCDASPKIAAEKNVQSDSESDFPKSSLQEVANVF